MSADSLDDIILAGRITGHVLREVSQRIRPGARVVDICELAEHRLLDRGATGLAFPCNISIDDVAAHYTSPQHDSTLIPDSGLVKVDIGAHMNGYLADSALTIDLDGSHPNFISAAHSALQAAIAEMHPGVTVGHIGTVIEREIRRIGLTPVYQLAGHEMRRWTLHAGLSIPNISSAEQYEIKAGHVYAIEPFATDGTGAVAERRPTLIFSGTTFGRPDLPAAARDLLKTLHQRFRTLPFALRWVQQMGLPDVEANLRTLINAGAIRGYPVLVEASGGIVSQFEHTVLVTEDGPVVTTAV